MQHQRKHPTPLSNMPLLVDDTSIGGSLILHFLFIRSNIVILLQKLPYQGSLVS